MIKHWVVWRLKPNTGCNDVSLTHSLAWRKTRDTQIWCCNNSLSISNNSTTKSSLFRCVVKGPLCSATVTMETPTRAFQPHLQLKTDSIQTYWLAVCDTLIPQQQQWWWRRWHSLTKSWSLFYTLRGAKSSAEENGFHIFKKAALFV